MLVSRDFCDVFHARGVCGLLGLVVGAFAAVYVCCCLYCCGWGPLLLLVVPTHLSAPILGQIVSIGSEGCVLSEEVESNPLQETSSK